MVNFYQSILVNVYMANNAPYFILLCLMPHDFTQKGENKQVNVFRMMQLQITFIKNCWLWPYNTTDIVTQVYK